jgi:hypothetical protein
MQLALKSSVISVELSTGRARRFAASASGLRDASVSDDGRWLAVAYAGEVVFSDAADPDHLITTAKVTAANPDVSFVPGGSIAIVGVGNVPRTLQAFDASTGDKVATPSSTVPWFGNGTMPAELPTSGPFAAARPAPACDFSRARGQLPGTTGAFLYQCDKRIFRDHPDTGAPADALLDLDPGAWLRGWQEESGVVVVRETQAGDRLLFVRPKPGAPPAKLTLSFTVEGEGGMAIDDAGYFTFFGTTTPAFRAAASCGHARSIELCADSHEIPTLIASFVRGDLSYREASPADGK